MIEPIPFPRLEELPKPPDGKVGWPWTETMKAFPAQMADGSNWPKISIVTPSFNQGQFIEETIRSILLQGYPNLEYIIIDGGSTDRTLKIIENYEPWLSYWVSEKDDGPASAINKGIRKCTGEWFNWINSDDLLLPRSLETLIKIARYVPSAYWISGGRLNLTAEGCPGGFSIPWLIDPTIMFFNKVFLPQDATFIKMSFLLENSNLLNEDSKNIFDTILHYELFQVEPPLLTNAIFSAMRWHKNQITSLGYRRENEESEYLKEYPKTKRITYHIVSRLLKTRYNNVVRSLLALTISLGLSINARRWKACCYVPWEHDFLVIPAWKWLMSGM
jgi:glycosyltransferase involved in cell wall biosynthesis